MGVERRLQIYWDTSIRGFGLVVGREHPENGSTRSFVVQKDVRGRSVRVSLGKLGDITLHQARLLAHDAIFEMRKGINPNQRKRQDAVRGVTLAESIGEHQRAMQNKGRSPRSVEELRAELGRYMKDWFARPLADIEPNDCAIRHERITDLHGPYAANRTFRYFRACYNTAAKRRRDLPPHPVVGVTFNREERRREPIPWSELPSWRAKVDEIENRIRQDLQLFILFTGLRRTDACTVRWEEIDLETACICRPMPKGGLRRAFTVPVNSFALDILRRRRKENTNDGGWVFPSKNRLGEVIPVREPKEKNLPSPNRLRDTFSTAAHEARVHPFDLKILLNHALPRGSDVTDGYKRPSVEHLQRTAELVADFLLEKMGSNEVCAHLSLN